MVAKSSKGEVFSLGFEKEAVGWLIEHLGKAAELGSLGFNRKYRGKTRAHLLEVRFNNHGRFIRISKFALNRRTTFLIIPKGKRGVEWEKLKKTISSLVEEAVTTTCSEEKWQSFGHGTKVGSLNRSFASVVKEEGL